MKAILIARVSTMEQRDAGNSLPAQIARLEQYCRLKRFEMIRTFSFGESAYRETRTEFDAVVTFILAQNEPIAVCCDKVDRFSRNQFDKRVAQLYEKALAGQLELHFVSDGQVIHQGMSAGEKFAFNIHLGLSRYYSDAVSDNVKRGLEEKLRKGEYPARAPFGYQHMNADIIINEPSAEVVRHVFTWYASGAHSLESVRKKVYDTYQISWSKGYVDWILKNEFYCGTMTWNKKQYPHWKAQGAHLLPLYAVPRQP